MIEMQHELFAILKNSLSITFFVMAMMLFIEYVNVRTSGAFCKKIQQRGWRQIVIGVLLGVLPGCLGTYTVVTLFSHNLVSFGALLATFIATTGDEAFLLFSLDVKTAVLITGVLVGFAAVCGAICDMVYRPSLEEHHVVHFEVHKHHADGEMTSSFFENLRHASPHRALLLFGVLLIFVLSLLGEIGHSHDILPMETEHEHHGIDWFSVTFVVISLASAYVIAIVSDHFLETHFWNHIVKKHFFKMLGWTTCILALIHVLDNYVELQDYVSQYQWQVLLMAILIGLIPVSGPHILFISLYLSGTIPFTILLANMLVQDGHGGLPLFAESKSAFFIVKGIKAAIAFAIGSCFIMLNV